MNKTTQLLSRAGLVIALLCQTPNAAYASDETPPNMLASYEFEDNANDSSGKDNHGVIRGSLAYAEGYNGKAAVLDGSSAYIELPMNILRNQTDFTFSLRFKTSDNGALLGYQNQAAGSELNGVREWIPLLYVGTDGKLRASFYDGSGTHTIVSDSAVNNGEWHQAVLSVSTNLVRLYIDDQYVGEITAPVKHLNMSYNQLGVADNLSYSPSNNGWFFYKGLLDDVRLQTGSYAMSSIGAQYAAELEEGYQKQDRQTLELSIQNAGTQTLDHIQVALSGPHADAFELGQPEAITLNKDGSTRFTLQAKEGLAAGTYTATVTISADYMVSQSFTVTQSVRPRPVVPETTPSAAIHYIAEQLSGLVPDGLYTINGKAITVGGSGTVPLEPEWLGSTLEIIKTGNGTSTSDSAAQLLVIPPRPEAPTVAANDSRNVITDLDTTMEFAVDGEAFIRFNGSNAPKLDGRKTVHVRYGATDHQFTGKHVELLFTPNPYYPSSSTASPVASATQAEVLVNGNAESAGTLRETEIAGLKRTTVVVDPVKLQQRLEAAGANAVITIPVSSDSRSIAAELTGESVALMQQLHASLVLQTPQGSYTLSSGQIKLDSIADQSDKKPALSLSGLTIQIAITNATPAEVQKAQQAAADNGLTIVAAPLEFTVTASHDGKQVTLAPSGYVEQAIVLPTTVNPAKVTTGVMLKADGTLQHVPTQVKEIDGTSYAVIHSLTNRTLAVIWNPLAFEDMEHHWAKKEVNDMGARLVVDGVDGQQFQPNATLTRAELAAIMVRGLGLPYVTSNTAFVDLVADVHDADSLRAAVAYGLMSSYEDGMLRPEEAVTREQAMQVVAKAMKLTGLLQSLGTVSVDSLSAFTDSTSVAEWAREDTAAVVKAGLVKGHSGLLQPQALITRAEVATLVQRLLEQSQLID